MPKAAWRNSSASVRCSYFDVSELDDPALMARVVAELPWPERLERAGRLRFATDRRLCLGAGWLAAHMLGDAGASDLTLGYGAHGKPYLVNHPSIHFNLSHSGTLAACAVADMPVGIDVETVRDHGEAVARYCCQPKELDWLRQAPDRAWSFTRLWVRKESYIKLTGDGLSREPRSFSVLPGETPKDDTFFIELPISDALIDTLICVCTHGRSEVRLTRWSSREAR